MVQKTLDITINDYVLNCSLLKNSNQAACALFL